MKQYEIDRLIELFTIKVGEEEKSKHVKSTKIRTALVNANKMNLVKRLGGVYRD